MKDQLVTTGTGVALAALAVYIHRRRTSSSLPGKTEQSSELSDPSKHMPPGQQHHPSAMRNRIPILKALLEILPESSTFTGPALEIATGTGALMEVVAPAYPHLSYQPSEYVPEVAATPAEQWSRYGKIGLRLGLDELANINEHGSSVFPNCRPAIALDLLQWPWPQAVMEEPLSFVLILVANTLHITPWQCSINLFRGVGAALAPNGHLIIYGPFKVGGEFIGADGGVGNAKFDEKLRSTNGEWGIRDVNALSALADEVGLRLKRKVGMPANNLTLCFVRK